MKILDVKSLSIEDVKVIRFKRFQDNRGYFTETYRRSDFESLDFLKDEIFYQNNESFSKKGTIRGLHFQWNPYMGKLVRTINGRMIDMVLDIRKNSSTFGKIIAYDMPSFSDMDYNEWIWVPKGFAHGNFFTEETYIEYYCTSSYNPLCEAGISPLSDDIDWSLCDKKLKDLFDTIKENSLISEKDKDGLTLNDWKNDDRSNNFL